MKTCCFTWGGPREPHWECCGWQWPGGSDGEWTMRVHGEDIPGEAWGRRLFVLRHHQCSDCIWHSSWTGSPWKWLYRKQELWGLRLSAFQNVWIDELKTNRRTKNYQQWGKRRPRAGSVLVVRWRACFWKREGMISYAALILYCCILYDHKSTTEYTYYLTVSMGQESEHRLARFCFRDSKG